MYYHIQHWSHLYECFLVYLWSVMNYYATNPTVYTAAVQIDSLFLVLLIYVHPLY